MSEWPAPFSTYRTAVRSEWLDYNGHMHDSSYGIVFSEANEELFAALDLSAEYRTITGASLYTVECHIRFLSECALGQVLTATTMLIAADAKKVRLYTELRADGRASATSDSLYLHVDTARGVTSAMPADRQDRLQQLLAAHAMLPRPQRLGLGVGAALAREGDR